MVDISVLYYTENPMHVQTVGTRPFSPSPSKGCLGTWLLLRVPVYYCVCALKEWGERRSIDFLSVFYM